MADNASLVNNGYLDPNHIRPPSSRPPVNCSLSSISLASEFNNEQDTTSHTKATHTRHAHAPLSPSSSCSSNSTLVNSRTFCLEDFKVLRPIGEGAEGTVYCALDRITRECMALKVVSKNRKKEKQIRSLLAEQNTLSFLNREPWFVGLQASWSDSQNFYLAMVRVCDCLWSRLT